MKKLAYLFLLAFVSNFAFADAGVLQFNGSVSTTCAFSSTTDGVLTATPSNPQVLSTNNTGGTKAGINLSYVGTPTLSIQNITGFSSLPNGVSNNDFSFSMTPTSGRSQVFTLSNGYYTTDYTTGYADIIEIAFAASYVGSAVPTGSYGASSTITCQ